MCAQGRGPPRRAQDSRKGTDISWAPTACPGLPWALSHHLTWSSGNSRRREGGFVGHTRSPRRGEGLCRPPAHTAGAQVLAHLPAETPAWLRAAGSRGQEATAAAPSSRADAGRGAAGAGRASASPPPPGPPSSSSSWAGFPEPAGVGQTSGWPRGALGLQLHGDPAASARPFVRPSVRPAMVAPAPAPRILLLLLLLLPPPGGEPLGVGECVPARDEDSHVCSGPGPNPGIAVPTVPSRRHSHPFETRGSQQTPRTDLCSLQHPSLPELTLPRPQAAATIVLSWNWVCVGRSVLPLMLRGIESPEIRVGFPAGR